MKILLLAIQFIMLSSQLAFATTNSAEEWFITSRGEVIEIASGTTQGTAFFIEQNGQPLLVTTVRIMDELLKNRSEPLQNIKFRINLQHNLVVLDIKDMEQFKDKHFFKLAKENVGENIPVTAIGLPYKQLSEISGQTFLDKNSSKILYMNYNELLSSSSYYHLQEADGSPVVNSQKEVIGIISEVTHSFAIIQPIDALNNLLSQPELSCNWRECLQKEIERVKQAAIQDPHAQYVLAQLHHHGRAGVIQSETQTFLNIKEAATKGLAVAQMLLSFVYLNGSKDAGVPQNLQQAFLWMKTAGNNGFFPAQIQLNEINVNETTNSFRWMEYTAQKRSRVTQFILNTIYQPNTKVISKPAQSEKRKKMREVIQNVFALFHRIHLDFNTNLHRNSENLEFNIDPEKESFNFMLDVSWKGYYTAPTKVSSTLFHNITLEPDQIREAIELVALKAAQGHFGAQMFLFNIYDLGTTVTQKNPMEALKLLLQLEEFYAPSKGKIYKMLIRNTVLMKKIILQLEPDQIEEAIALVTLKANQGNPVAQFILSKMYLKGTIVTPKNPMEALRWMSQAAQRYTPAQNQLKKQLLRINKLEPDRIEEAFKLILATVAEQKTPWAREILGFMMYQIVEEGTQNPIKSLKLLLQVAEFHIPAQEETYEILFDDTRLEPDQIEEAFDVTLAAARQNNPWAQKIVSLMYKRGVGVTKDNMQSFYWMSKAKEQQHPGAELALNLMRLLGIGVSPQVIPALGSLWKMTTRKLVSTKAQKNPCANSFRVQP